MHSIQQWQVSYREGVFRFVSSNGQALTLAWATNSRDVEQHSSSATFAAPTTDGRRAWLTVSAGDQVIGVGYHGDSQNSYFRCGVAMDGIESAGPSRLPSVAATGTMLCGEGEPMRNISTWTLRYESGRVTFSSISSGSQALIWISEAVSVETFPGSLLYSGRTTDGRQAWINILNGGAIDGGGFHDAARTPGSFLYCGSAMNGVPRAG